MTHILRKIVAIDEGLCNGCGQCVLDCAEGAIAIVDGKARVIGDMYCDGLGACLSGCPTGALSIIERDAAPFDEQAVHDRLRRMNGGDEPAARPSTPVQAAGCPGMRAAPFSQGCAAAPGAGAPWPLKIRLMPPGAPFLRGADLVVAADCAAFAATDFHSQFGGKAILLIGCPKFEGMDALAGKLADIFREACPSSITVVRMEVPCCRGLSKACHDAAQCAAPVREAILSRTGQRVEPPLFGG